jgi:hypothetical protein
MADDLTHFRKTCAIVASLLLVGAIQPAREDFTIAVDFLASEAARLRLAPDTAQALIAAYLHPDRLRRLQIVEHVEQQQLRARFPGQLGASQIPDGLDFADVYVAQRRSDNRYQEVRVPPLPLFNYLHFMQRREHAAMCRLIVGVSADERAWLGAQLRVLRAINTHRTARRIRPAPQKP